MLSRLTLALGLVWLASLPHMAVAQPTSTDSAKVYIVQLADAPAAVYTGNLGALAATRPALGGKLDVRQPSVRAYVNYLTTQQNQALARLNGVTPLHRYHLAFNGFSARLNDAQVATLRSSATVKSIIESVARKMDTTHTPAFLGLTAPGGLWSQLDASAHPVKGEDVVIGIIDSGIWPENASFGDKVDASGLPVPYHQSGTAAYTPPTGWKGVCQTGPGFSAAMCNNKLIGARFYGTDFAAQGGVPSSFEYASPRDAQGHGSHTASTAGGNADAPAMIDGISAGLMSGVAPRARLAAYKVCWQATDEAFTGCFPGDVLKAIDDAVADGVDVINYSVAGTQTDFSDPIEIAYLNAAAAGVFIATSAGNSGPGNQVAHISPWLMTVAASTHDRYTVANAVLGSGAAFGGPSYQVSGLPQKPLVLARDAGTLPFDSLSASDQIALQRCYNAADRAALGGSVGAALDPAKVAGKVVVCYRGANVLVNKADAVKAAGGSAMLLLNVPALPPGLPASNDTVVLQPYVVPAVHLSVAAYPTIANYAAQPGATAGLTSAVQQPDVVAPVMASFSSRGPNKGNGDILKPDITAPGVDIIAAYVASALTPAQHDALALGNYTPQSNAFSLQGTSMSSPHVAGAAALLKQLHPGWSPAALKSALMTSGTGVRMASGAPDPDRWGYGAGHLNPNGAANPGLVYDINPADYGRFLCGRGLSSPPGIGSCASLVDTLTPGNLNLASITASNVNGSRTLTRTVTNVTGATTTFTASASLPNWTVAVVPPSLTLAAGQSQSFKVTLTAGTGAIGAWSFGNLTWTSGVSVARSPLSAIAVGFSAPAEIIDKRASGAGSKTFPVIAPFTGPVIASATGLQAATMSSGTATNQQVQCFDFSVSSGTQFARFQLFNEDTQGGSAVNLDLEVFKGPNGTGPSVGASGGVSSDEVVTLTKPAAGVYSACVAGTSVPKGGAGYSMASWIVGDPVGPQTLKTASPPMVYEGRSATFGLSWSVAAGKRYMGLLRYLDRGGATLGSSIVTVDNH